MNCFLNRLIIVSVLFFSISVNSLVFSQTNFYAPDTIQKVEITFTQPNWDYMLDTSKNGLDGYIVAATVVINGVSFTNAGVKYKGYSSYDSSKTKNPLHIKLDYIQNNANYQGFEDVKLSNGFSDPSSVREVLSYEILRNYMDAPQSNFVKVYINGKYYGVYSSSESIDKGFLKKKFYSSDNAFFKCNPANLASGKIPNLLYYADSANYYPRYEIKSDAGWKDLINLCDTLNNRPAHIDSVLDVDRALWMLAFNNVTVNLDSYTGAFSQNYYLYRDGNDRFVPVIWDLNMCMGGFSKTGSSALDITGMKNMTPVLHSTNGARPLITHLLANPTYTKMYIAHMRTIDSEFFSNGKYFTRAQKLQALIDTSVQAEKFSLYSYPQFQSALTATVGNIPGIKTLMGARDTFLNSTTQFQQVQPTITDVTTSPSVIYLNDVIWVSCKVSQQNSVMLGYRDQTPKRFRRVMMYDDGLHHDGTAADGVFGAGIIASSSLIQYYIYAENANAGIFSPVRAEHEFHTVPVVISFPSVGDVLINEFLADNINDTTDELGQHEDWIELYNTTSTPLNLYGLYLSDDITSPTKFAFPTNSIIKANSYITIWADEDNTTASYIHCNFKLATSGEKILLSTPNAFLDSITFGAQSADISIGRCPDGGGKFGKILNPTFNKKNDCTSGVEENILSNGLSVSPNPSNGIFNITSLTGAIKSVEISDILGNIIPLQFMIMEQHSWQCNATLVPDGIYILRINGNAFSKIIIAR